MILKNIERHVRLSAEEQNYFLSLLRKRILKRKEFLLHAGEVCRFENFVSRGCLRTYTIDARGVEHVLMFAPEDWWTGDLYSFLSSAPSQYYIDALEDTEVLQVSREDLEKLYIEVPAFERFFRIMFQNAFIAQQQRIATSIGMTAEERYQEFLRKYRQLDLRIPQKQIASFLGITPVFLSMLRKKATAANS